MDNEQSYFKDDEEEKLLASLSDEEFLEYMECLAIEIEEEEKENE